MSEPARLLSGRYRLGEPLGRGGSASVVAAVDTHTGAAVAVKILHAHLTARPVAREAFLAAARRVQAVRHPNVVGVLGVGIDETGDVPLAWICLERAAGSTLAGHVARWGPLDPADAVAVADGVLRALAAAHSVGLVHRDVSPSNVMVATDATGAIRPEHVRLLDFGLAARAGETARGTDDLLSVDATGNSGVIGNAYYMAPEQVLGLPIDTRGDVYQVGAMLHFAVTGRPPFPGESEREVMHAHLDAPPPVPSSVRAGVPRSLDRIVVRAMLKDPADRFASAAAMRAALASVTLDGPRRSARPVGGSIPPLGTPSETEAVTRVYGATTVPARAANAPDAPPSDDPPRAVRPGRRSRAGAWIAAVAGVALAAAVMVSAASSAPTGAMATPTATPSASATPEPTAVVAPPEPDPPDPDPVVATRIVPDLASLSVSELGAALAAAGLVLGAVTYADSPFPHDVVLRSVPSAGQQAEPGTAVAVTASSGSNTVPDVSGLPRQQAEAALLQAGFVPVFTIVPGPSGTAAGAILGTSPRPGTRLEVGESVAILEASIDDPTPVPTPTAPSPTPSPGAGGGA